jgi:putative phosphoserine phosphatase/1-acylglycerol-3-phosphate O-acyltransferase
MTSVAELVAEVEAGPGGPEIGAFFDVDGTLIAGYSANVFYQDFLRRLQISPIDIGRSVVAAVDVTLRDADVTKLTQIAAAAWEGRSEDELLELGERLFVQRIAGMVYPAARELVRAHQRMGHTVAIASSATTYQVTALAQSLEIDDVLCTVVEVADGLVTGQLTSPVVWGPEKARRVRELASDRGIDLQRSYAYANGDEDVPFLETVGNPRALNPQGGLAREARERGWTALKLGGRGRPGLREVVRTGAALSSMGTAATLGVGIGLLNRSRREAANFATAVGADAALALSGVTLDVVGEENAWKQRPAVFVFNHQSSLDMLVLGAVLRRDITGVAKKEASRDPRFAPLGLLVDVAYVDRGNTAQAKKALEPAVKKLRDGYSICIAPEGTRSPTPRLGRFKKGAFHIAMQAGVPIVPIVIRNAGDVMWRNSFFVRPGTVEVAVLEPIGTEDWKVETIGDHVRDVRERFEHALEHWPDGGDPVTEPAPAPEREPERPASPSDPQAPAPARAR